MNDSNEKNSKTLPEFQKYVLQNGIQMNFKKGESVFRQGDPHQYVYIIRKGILKGIYITDDGHEYIKTIIKENDFIGSLAALMGDVCSFSLICLEKVEAVALEFADVEKDLQNNHELSLAMISALKTLALKKEMREYEFLCLSAENRYRLMLKRSPEIINRLTQNDVALYLGITPVALSRIRSRIQKSETNRD